jgi:hypothetical protein
MPKIRGICYICGWTATLNKMQDHQDKHRDNYYGCKYTMNCLHSGEPIVKNRLSQDVSEVEEADDDSNSDRKLPAQALKTAEDKEDDGEDSEAFFDAAEEEEGGKLEEVMSQGEQALFQEVAQKNHQNWNNDIAMQKEGKEQAGEAKEEALEKAKEKKAKRRQPKRR